MKRARSSSSSSSSSDATAGHQAKKPKSEKQTERKASSSSRPSSMTVHTLTPAELKKAPEVHAHDEDGNSRDMLGDFLFPLSKEEFFKSYWKQRAFAVVGSSPDRFQRFVSEHLADLDLETLLGETESDNIFVWMKSKNVEDTKIGSFELTDVEAAMTCYNAGASLYFRTPPALAKLFVRTMADAVGMNFASVYPNGDNMGEIETFVARAGHVTDWHFDFMENFTFQLRGSKTWKMRKGDIPHPIRGCTPHYKTTEVAEQQVKVHRLTDPRFSMAYKPGEDAEYDEVTLTAGSVLYHPAGIWHRVECTEDNISINVSLIATTWADLICSSLKQMLWKHDEFRQGVSGVESAAQARKKLDSLLSTLSGSIVPSLRSADLLPNPLFLPRPRRIEIPLDDSSAADAKQQKKAAAALSLDTPLRCNSLAVLVKQSDYLKASTPSASSSSSPSSSSSSSSSSAGDPKSKAHKKHGKSKAGGGGAAAAGNGKSAKSAAKRGGKHGAKKAAAAAAGDDEDVAEGDDEDAEMLLAELAGGEFEIDECDSDHEDGEHMEDEDSNAGWVLYMLHINFGNESLESAVRLPIRVAPELSALVDAIIAAFAGDKRASPKQVLAALPAGCASREQTLRVLSILRQQGYLLDA